GTSLFSLTRNIGSSIGISIVTVLLTHYTQVNHAELATHISPFNPNLWTTLPSAARGDPTSLSIVDQLVNTQALMISYVDDFKFMMLITLCAMPLVLLLRMPRHSSAPGGEPAAAME